GLAASILSKPGATYVWTLVGGTIDSGQGTNAIDFTSGLPGTVMKVFVVETDATGCLGEAEDSLQVDFSDVPPTDPFYSFVCTVGRDGISAGCGGGFFCRDDPVTRAQMAVFLLKAEHTGAYLPPPCSGIFLDVPCPGQFTDWIEQLSTEGITAGCGGGNYCPYSAVTRAQMSAFLLKAKHGSTYQPPACVGRFGDVPCPSPFADWIEELAAEGITAGCGNGNYCPASPNSRGQMAVFLTKTFSLP
ncbi:MAG TPA: S-layer homology domain-containing protein, partial [Thermoanaerobaculia bacterium]|nr:S-layer homology domain-containing protein [Thermoanaerobaculia bacterium]